MNFKTNLDEINAREFEVLVSYVMRKIGYKKVQLTNYTNDEGKDILALLKHKDGEIPVVVECKHQKSKVGRPVVQKLHSAVLSLKSKGMKKGLVVTSSLFSQQAIDYATQINSLYSQSLDIELIDGKKLREWMNKARVKTLNSRIEVISRLYFPYCNFITIKNEISNCFDGINFIRNDLLSIAKAKPEFKPIFRLNFSIDKRFSTTIGQVASIKEDDISIYLDGSGKEVDNTALSLLNKPSAYPIKNDNLEGKRFAKSESELINLAITQITDHFSREIEYRGNNNVTYRKLCQLSPRDILINDFGAFYLPYWRIRVRIKDQQYKINFYNIGSEIVKLSDDSVICRICGKNILGDKRWLCNICGKITCRKHKKICKVCNQPVCNDCKIVKRYIFTNKSFCQIHCKNKFEKDLKKINFLKRFFVAF